MNRHLSATKQNRMVNWHCIYDYEFMIASIFAFDDSIERIRNMSHLTLCTFMFCGVTIIELWIEIEIVIRMHNSTSGIVIQFIALFDIIDNWYGIGVAVYDVADIAIAIKIEFFIIVLCYVCCVTALRLVPISWLDGIDVNSLVFAINDSIPGTAKQENKVS